MNRMISLLCFYIQTATMYPGIMFGITFLLNFFILGKHSSGTVPFSTMVALLCMWFGISLPLVYLGYYFGFRKQVRLVLSYDYGNLLIVRYSCNTNYNFF